MKKRKNLSDLSYSELKAIEPNLKDDIKENYGSKIFSKFKKSYGGTSFENIKKMIKKYKNV